MEIRNNYENFIQIILTFLIKIKMKIQMTKLRIFYYNGKS